MLPHDFYMPFEIFNNTGKSILKYFFLVVLDEPKYMYPNVACSSHFFGKSVRIFTKEHKQKRNKKPTSKHCTLFQKIPFRTQQQQSWKKMYQVTQTLSQTVQTFRLPLLFF